MKVAEAAGAANNQEQEDWDADLTPSPCLSLPELKDMVSQLNQDPRAELTADSGHGTISMEEDIKPNAVKEEPIKDDTSYIALDNSGGPDDLTWSTDIAYFELTNDSTMACKTPVAASTPVVVPAGDTVLSSPESPWSKKPCVCEMVAERLQSTSTVIMEPDYKDTPLNGYREPYLSEVIPWICFEAQNMMEPLWWTEMASIKQNKNIRYIAAMFVWF